MELEGLTRNLDKLEFLLNIPESNQKIDIATDGHKQVRKYLREQRNETVNHYLDIWHSAKNLDKKINRLKSKLAKRWSKSIINHLFYVVKKSGSNIPLRIEMWRSIANHIANKHVHESELFPECTHGDLSGERPKAWFKSGSEDYDKLCEVLLKRVSLLSTYHFFRRFLERIVCFQITSAFSTLSANLTYETLIVLSPRRNS